MTKKEIADLERQQRIRFINGIYRKTLTIIEKIEEVELSEELVKLKQIVNQSLISPKNEK